jgi:hypothetical protein
MGFPLTGVACTFWGLIMENIHGNNGSIIDIINDPFGFTFNEINRVLGENDSRALYTLLYKNNSQKKITQYGQRTQLKMWIQKNTFLNYPMKNVLKLFA